MEWLYWLIILVPLGVIGWGTIVKNRWGINFAKVTCPNCGTPAPTIRKPASGQQAMWGGTTCEKCGTAYDKWGRQLTPPTKAV